jgi:hypothetical protein
MLLAAACVPSLPATPAHSPTPVPPTVTSTSAPTLPPSATPTLTRTPRPTRTPTSAPTLAPGTPTSTPTPLPPGAPTPTPTIRGVGDAPPPFDIELPDGWREQYKQFAIVGPDGSIPLKVAGYSGKTPSYEAFIVVLWDYPTIHDEGWRDGIELVQVVFDPSCQFSLAGSPPQAQTYVVGRHYAKGIAFEVQNCETEPDVKGWLVGFRRAEINYLFYVRLAPMEGAETDFPFVQSILDTIRFPGEE